MKNFQVEYNGNDIVAYNKLLFKVFPLTLFDPTYLVSNTLLSSNHKFIQHGRGEIYSFEYQNISLVLRHYQRGGVPAKFIDDKYLWTDLQSTRALQELKILMELYSLGLPVPQPAAAHVHKQKLTYQADIITVLIPNAKTLSSLLTDSSLNEKSWSQIGMMIKRFHNKNCNHADLNAHNIMHDGQDNFYLIDFDKARFDTSDKDWRTLNLKRLRRSLEKLSSNSKGFNYTSKNFLSLMHGYAKDD